MAKRDQLVIIRAARAGQAAAQLTLGRNYLFGAEGLPKSAATALHWLDRAARQNMRDAWILIGSHISFETAQRATGTSQLWVWYEKAFDAGVVQAGLVLARLVQMQGERIGDQAIRRKALHALRTAAHAGIADAQWLLAQHGASAEEAELAIVSADDAGAVAILAAPCETTTVRNIEWTVRAADGGVAQARTVLADQAWAAGDHAAFLRWSLPAARDLVCRLALPDSARAHALRLRAEDVKLLSRCGHALLRCADADRNEMENILEHAARAGDREAQFSLGLWCARTDVNGERADGASGSANYKRAIYWLSLSGKQGEARAWHAVSKIYLKSAFSQRNVSEALHYLERAAEAGYVAAQLELGTVAWRARSEDSANEVRALYWLQKAAAQGNADAEKLLKKIAPPSSAPWAGAARRILMREFVKVPTLLMARIELAALFGLSRPEALLIDLNAADQGHCLLVDIRAQYARSRRRLILVRTTEERQALDRLAHTCREIGCSPNGPEGNYRQRLYRFKTLVPDE